MRFKNKHEHNIKTLIVSGAAMLTVSFAMPVFGQDQPSDQSGVRGIATAMPVQEAEQINPLANFESPAVKDQIRTRPLLFFRQWANKPLPPVQTFFFLLFVTVLAGEIIPARLELARLSYARRFWKCLWAGFLGCLIFVALARALFLSEIGMPLAIGSLAVLQLLLLLGFAVSSTLIGEAILVRLRVDGALSNRKPWVLRQARAVTGTLILFAIVMIPGIGMLPRIGIRLIMLLCFLGMGALFRTRMGTKDVDTVI